MLVPLGKARVVKHVPAPSAYGPGLAAARGRVVDALEADRAFAFVVGELGGEVDDGGPDSLLGGSEDEARHGVKVV